MASVVLKQGRHKSVSKRHPWIFSGGIYRVNGEPAPGETVEVVSAEGNILARGAFSPHSQIRVRIWSFDPSEMIDSSFFARRLSRAITARQYKPREGVRLVNAESDELPGVIVDRYSDYLVCQFLTAGAEYHHATIVQELNQLVPVSGIYNRSDMEMRQREGLKKKSGVLAGSEPPEAIEINEGSSKFLVNIVSGHKTGFYLDQSENRRIIGDFVSGASVLNCFAYTGAFGIAALKARASKLVNVESSAEALKLAGRNLELNGLEKNSVENVEGDVFEVLRKYRDENRFFDVVLLDPPKFAESRSHLTKATRGYKDINLLAMKLLKPGGILITFSCSGLIDSETFQRCVSFASIDAGRHVQVLRRLSQSADHPVALNFPEGLYLKGLVCRVW